MSKRLRSPYENSVTVGVGQVSAVVPIVFNDYSHVWVVEQITATYSNHAEAVAASVSQNGVMITGGPMVRSSIPGSTNNLVQTFAGNPYIYIEAADEVQVNFTITGGETTANQLATIYVQYRELTYKDPELAGRY